jgi:hypothetical protein
MPRIGGVASLDNVVPNTRTVATAPPLAGGGDLTADRNISVAIGTSAGTVASGGDSRFTNARAWSLFTGNPANGQVPVWNGATFVPTNPSASAGSFTSPPTKTAAYTIAPGEFVRADTSGGAVTLTLPTAPPDGSRVGWALVTAGNTLAVACGGTDVFNKPSSGVTTMTPVLAGQAQIAQYDGTNHVWVVQANNLPLSALDARYIAVGGAPTTPDATTTSKGVVQLAGDLGGNAATPVVVNGEKTTNKSTAGTLVPNGYIGADSTGKAPAPLLPAATTSTSGIIVLSGDLGGTSASPTVIKRGPAGTTPIYQPTYVVGATPAPDLGCHMRVANCTGNVAFAYPTAGTGVDGQRYLAELQMTSTTNRTITLDSQYEIGATVTSRTIVPGGTATVWVYIGLILRGSVWRVLAVDAGA